MSGGRTGLSRESPSCGWLDLVPFRVLGGAAASTPPFGVVGLACDQQQFWEGDCAGMIIGAHTIKRFAVPGTSPDSSML